MPPSGAESGAVVAQPVAGSDFDYLKFRWPHLPDDLVREILGKIQDSVPNPKLIAMP